MSERKKQQTWIEAQKEGRTPWRPNTDQVFADANLEPGNILVRRWKEERGSKFSLFSIFVDSEHLLKYIFSRAEGDRDMYEIVVENQYQKARFDIEFSASEQKLTSQEADRLIAKIVGEIRYITDALFPGLDTGFREYSSHDIDKRSTHIVLSKLCHPNSRDSRMFYDLVIKYMTPELRKYVDVMVYSTFQNFRMLYCEKLGTGRPKMLVNPKLQQPNIIDFNESLLGHLDPQQTRVIVIPK